MAILLYSNGIIEEYRPKDLVFTEQELINLFSEYSEIKSTRLITVLNTWCIYGSYSDPDPQDFNRIASDLVSIPIYSHVLYVHDSEINPDWKITEEMLYKNYLTFLNDIKRLIDDAANNIINEIESSNEYEEKVLFLPNLITIGTTYDKKVLFGFNPKDQTTEFYKNEEFYKFALRVYEYLSNNKQIKEPFTIYEDKKAIIIVDSEHVKFLLSTMLEKFKNNEEYEICTDIRKIIDSWPPKVRRRKKKSSNESDAKK